MNAKKENIGMIIFCGFMLAVGIPFLVFLWITEGRFSWMASLGVLGSAWGLYDEVKKYWRLRDPHHSAPPGGESGP
ncbi:hypothetical protein HNR10_003063 [Nocardiopsis aegyptia]|uniref:Uncharacterized protein n=1 Tax=Nocardiopsis aegyptia TaxID=220378 RepID=A0A7Z0EN38_9ACTN|nr:hypothetical protein [Nocardiopsis aegyptia]